MSDGTRHRECSYCGRWIWWWQRRRAHSVYGARFHHGPCIASFLSRVTGTWD